MFLHNHTKNETLWLSLYGLGSAKKIRDLLTFEVENHLIPDLELQSFVQSWLGRWSVQDKLAIDFDVDEYYYSIDEELKQVLACVSMINYGITFQADENTLEKTKTWFDELGELGETLANEHKRKRDNGEGIIDLPYTFSDLWAFYVTHLGTPLAKTTLQTVTDKVYKKFKKKPISELVKNGRVPFESVMMSDEFVPFLNKLAVIPGQLVNTKFVSLEVKQLGNMQDPENIFNIYEFPDNIQGKENLEHPLFEKEVFFKKDLVLQQHEEKTRFTFVPLKGTKIKLKSLIAAMCGFVNGSRYYANFFESLYLSDVVENDGNFNTDECDPEGKIREPIGDAHIWVLSLTR